jgi:hypothetical protein
MRQLMSALKYQWVQDFSRRGYESDRAVRSKWMDTVTLIRVVAGALAVVVIFIIIWRRRRKTLE